MVSGTYDLVSEPQKWFLAHTISFLSHRNDFWQKKSGFLEKSRAVVLLSVVNHRHLRHTA